MLICDNVIFAGRCGLVRCGADADPACAGAGQVRVQLARGGAGRVWIQSINSCAGSVKRGGPRGRVRT